MLKYYYNFIGYSEPQFIDISQMKILSAEKTSCMFRGLELF